jgi:threonine synthase
MGRLKGLTCRECGRYYPSSPVHVCEFCFGPLEVDYDYDAIRRLVTRERIEAGLKSIWRYADLLGLKTPDVLHGILSSDVIIRPSLSAFDRALAELKAKPE